MQKGEIIKLNTTFDYDSLTSIDGIRLTNRQIDVAACLTGRQRYKDIGKILSIASSTVDDHLAKIKAIVSNVTTYKPTEVLDFFESSNYYHKLKEHYVKLLLQHIFEKDLKDISINHNTDITYLVKYHESINKHDSLNKKIREHLKIVGIAYNIYEEQSFYRKNENKGVNENIIHILPAGMEVDLNLSNQSAPTIYIFLQNTHNEVLDEKQNSAKQDDCYYQEFFKLLQIIFKEASIEKNAKAFEIKQSRIKHNLISNKSTISLSTNAQNINTPVNSYNIAIHNASNKTNVQKIYDLCAKNKIMIAGVFLFAIASLFWLSLLKNEQDFTVNKDPVITNFNLPHQLNYYTPRFNMTKAIWDKLDGGDAKQTAILAGLHGLGGVGKTTLAINAIHNSKQYYDFRGWFSAETKDLLKADYLELGELLFLLTKDMSDKLKISRVKNWLDTKKKILLVYDNAPDMETLTEFMPNKGHVIITSRNYELPGAIEVDVMSKKEALKLLDSLLPNKIKQSTDYAQQAKSLVNELGYLPLAISQAGAYITKNLLTIVDYLKLYYSEKSYLLTEKSMPPQDKHEPVYVTWNINIKNIKQQPYGDKALELLEFISYCYPEEIPKTLLTQYLYGNVTEKTVMRFNTILGILRQYSLVKISPDTITIHRLVQAWFKNALPKHKELIILKKGALAIEKVYPQQNELNLKKLALIKLLAAHAEAILSHMEPLISKSKIEAINLIMLLGNSYRSLEDYHKAKDYYEQGVNIYQAHYGSNCPQSIKALHMLGRAKQTLGHFKEAKQDYEEALIICNKHYGRESVQSANILNALGKLGGLAMGANKQEAEEVMDRLQLAIRIYEKNYGEDSVLVAKPLCTLGALNNLYLGNYRKGKEYIERAISLEIQHYGEQHVSLADSTNRLGCLFMNLGQFETSIKYLQQALRLEEKQNRTHAWKGTVLSNLGYVHINIGEYRKAKACLKRAVNVRKKAYGENHARVAESLVGLGQIHFFFNDINKAQQYIAQALMIFKKSENIWGEFYFSSAFLVSSLINEKMGQYSNALEDLTTAFRMDKEVYGDLLHQALAFRKTRAEYWPILGKHIVNDDYWRKALEIHQKLLGDKHYEVARYHYLLGQVLTNKQKTNEAMIHYQKALNILEPQSAPHPGLVKYYAGNIKNIKKHISNL